MPTVLQILGWRLFFYVNEGNEPIHIHCAKGDRDCKFWLDSDRYDITEAFSFNMSPRDMREVRRIIFNHFDYIEAQWDELQRRKGL